MKDSTAKKWGFGYNKELYKNQIYFWLHRVHVTAALFSIVGSLLFIFPVKVAVIIIFPIGLFFFLFLLNQRLKLANGPNTEFDFLFNMKFYKSTLIFSTLAYGIVITVFILKRDAFQGLINNSETGEIFVMWLKYPLLFTFLNSIFMLNKTFKRGS